jgi:hypothetical protein
MYKKKKKKMGRDELHARSLLFVMMFFINFDKDGCPF